MRQYSATVKASWPWLSCSGSQSAPLRSTAHGTLPSAAWYGRVPAHEVAHLGVAAHPQQRGRHRRAVADPRARVAPRAGLERGAVAVHEDVRGRRAQRVDAIGSGAERGSRPRRAAPARRASPPRARPRARIDTPPRRRRSRAPARRTAPRPPPRAPRRERARDPSTARPTRARSRRAPARAAAARRATRWRMTPPCSNAAAPNPLGGSSGITTLRPFTATAPPSHASSEIGLVPPIPWNDCHGGVTWNGRSAANRRTRLRRAAGVLDAVAHARARVRSVPGRERGRRQREIAPAPVRRRNRQARLRERLRDVGVRPGDELAVGEQERLEREAGAVRLDHPLLVHDRRGRPAVDTDRCPVGLLAVEPARVQPAPLARGHGVEEVVQRARELERLDAQRRDRESARSGGLVQQQPQLPRAPAPGQVDVMARALRLARRPQRPPGLAVVARLHVERARLAAGRPVDRRARRIRARRGSRARATAASPLRARCASSSPRRRRSRARRDGPPRRSTRARAAARAALRSSKRRSSSQTVPRPPGAAAIAISIAASSRSGPPPAGPQANVTSLLRMRSGCQSAGNSNASRCHHQTLRLLGSTSFSSSLFAGAAPRTRSASAQLSGIVRASSAARDHEAAAALEVEVEPQRAAVRARLARESRAPPGPTRSALQSESSPNSRRAARSASLPQPSSTCERVDARRAAARAAPPSRRARRPRGTDCPRARTRARRRSDAAPSARTRARRRDSAARPRGPAISTVARRPSSARGSTGSMPSSACAQAQAEQALAHEAHRDAGAARVHAPAALHGARRPSSPRRSARRPGSGPETPRRSSTCSSSPGAAARSARRSRRPTGFAWRSAVKNASASPRCAIASA